MEETTVRRSSTSPTGWEVRFVCHNEKAERVRIYGEWSFSDPMHSSINSSREALPYDWQNGDIVNTVKGWPVLDMKKEDEGLWTITLPLPSGTFGYYFLIDVKKGAEVDDTDDAEIVFDPAHVPFLADYTVSDLREKRESYVSFIHVPYDREKQSFSPDCSMEAPMEEKSGKKEYHPYKMADGSNSWYGIYTPYGYDEKREEQYPLLVLIGNHYCHWFNHGAADHILDNCIALGKTEPTVLLTISMPERIPVEENYRVLTEVILPEVYAHYNVSKDVKRHAIGGLSFSSAQAMYAYFHTSDLFQYYLIMSPPMKAHIRPDYTNEELKTKTLCIGYGTYDFVLLANIYYLNKNDEDEMVPLRDQRRFPSGSTFEYLWELGKHNLPFTNIELPYGHTWALWRRFAAEMFTTVLWK